MTYSKEELDIFRVEAVELLDTIETNLLELDSVGSIDSHYDKLIKSFNALSGGAELLKLVDLQSHIKSQTFLFADLKKNPGQIKQAVTQLLKGTEESRRLLFLDQKSSKIEIQNSKIENNVLTFEAKKKVAEAENSSIGKILVLDDEPDIVNILVDFLESENISAKGITSPSMIDEALNSFKPDVLFTDISMPKITGLQVLEKVSKTHPFMPVVFISGNVDKNVLLDAIRLGVFAVIEKPFDLARIFECAINAIQKYKLLRLSSKSINLLIYQFNDLAEHMKAQGNEDISKIIKTEIMSLVKQRHQLNRAFSKKTSGF